MRRLIAIFATVSLLCPAGAVHAAALDLNFSKVAADKTQLKADGIENVLVVVTLKDINLGPVVGAKVTLTSSRGMVDEIRIEQDTTDLIGKARFRVFSLKDGSAVFTAKVGDVVLPSTATITWSGGLSFPLVTGDLIKLPDDGDLSTQPDTAVYYYAKNGKRYVFPNDKCYFTWYLDFSKVKILPQDQMSLIPIGGNVTYHPGTKLVKFQTDTKTYAVSRGGTLRWVKTEDAVKVMYGSDWNAKVDDINEAFYINYKFGSPIEGGFDYAPDVVRNSVQSIDYDKGIE
ncbi:MAG TPA: invasin domain 3-containing protein [Candidatus Methylomirabilis sp.]|nr:invasin domain 3-containing protein [Candidatus Methylomirabilis sp.]